MTLTRSSRALSEPFQTSAGTLDERDVVHLELSALVDDEFHATGTGVAAPLPGWGDDSAREAFSDLRRVEAASPGAACELLEGVRSPSARFALSSALLDACARGRGVPIRRLLVDDPRDSIPVNATIGLVDAEAAAEQAERAVREGFGTIKLKVGGDPGVDARRVEAVGAVAPTANLRLDANGAWSLAEARTFLRRVASQRVEYVEQPVAADDLAGLGELTGDGIVPIAADESCLPLERAHDLVERELVDVLVLKPALAGAWPEVVDLMVAARDRAITFVLTSALGSAVSRLTTAQVAAALLRPDVACGLAGPTVAEPWSMEQFIRNGRLQLGTEPGSGLESPPTTRR